MKSLAKKISQNFVKDSNDTIKSAPNTDADVNKGLKKKRSIKDMMVDTFKNPFNYLKNDNVLPKNTNITDVKYTTFSSSEYESVFNKPIDPNTLTKSDPSRLIYVPKNLMQEADIQSDIHSSIFEGENLNDGVNDTNSVNSKDFNNISVQVAYSSNSSPEQSEEEEEEEEEEEKQSSESTLCSDSDNENQPSDKNKKETKHTFFPWSFIKSKISFSKLEVNTFCNDSKLTSYERYENYSSDNEMADISEDETAIELQVFHPSTHNELIDEKAMVPEPELDTNRQFSI